MYTHAWWLLLLVGCGPDRGFHVLDTPPPPTDPEWVDTDTDPVADTGTLPVVDPDCYWEPLDARASVSDLQSGFSANGKLADALDVLERRFPAGRDLLVEQAHDPYIDIFLEGSSWTNMMDSLGTVIHETVHGYDYEHAIYPNRFSYWMRDDLVLQARWIDGFPRSEILPYVQGSATSLYDGVYLTGTQGTYGFTELLDEANCYVNGLGGSIAGWDAIPWSTSAKDGPLAFLYYIALYVELAETRDPSLYTNLQSDPDVTEIVRTLWLRTHFLLESADQTDVLGIRDDDIRELLYGKQHVLEDFLGHRLAASPCLPQGV